MKSAHDFYLIPKVSSEDRSFDELMSFLIPRPGGRLLDIGCFDGSKTIIIRDQVQAGEVWGVDFNEDRIKEANSRGIHTLCVDLNADHPLDVSDEYFDVIICTEVIEHIYSPDYVMDEIARLLNPDGYALITTPNLASWKNRIVLLLGWQPFMSEVSTRDRYGNPLAVRGQPSGHLRIFTLPALIEMVHAAGLKPDRIGGLTLRSPQKNLMGSLSRIGDALLYRVPALTDILVVRCSKK